MFLTDTDLQTKLLGIYTNIINMLKDRKYTEIQEIAQEDFVKSIKNNEIYIPIYSKQACVCLLKPKNTLVKKNIDKIRNAIKADHIIYIADAPIKKNTLRTTKGASVMHYTDFIIDPLQHELNPPIQLLNEKEHEEFRTNGTFNLRNLPVILASDRVCRWLGALPGSIIKAYENFDNSNSLTCPTYFYVKSG
jgi:DNA-directed RNA polymerase subunit H (RpoH/RPB5)